MNNTRSLTPSTESDREHLYWIGTTMLRVRELEAWSRPGSVLPPEYGKDLAEELWALGVPRDVFLGLSEIPDKAHVYSLQLALESGGLSIEDFQSFCTAYSLVPKIEEAESASKFLEYSEGRRLAWIHLAEGSDPKLLYQIVKLAQARNHIVIDPETFAEVKT